MLLFFFCYENLTVLTMFINEFLHWVFLFNFWILWFQMINFLGHNQLQTCILNRLHLQNHRLSFKHLSTEYAESSYWKSMLSAAFNIRSLLIPLLFPTSSWLKNILLMYIFLASSYFFKYQVAELHKNGYWYRSQCPGHHQVIGQSLQAFTMSMLNRKKCDLGDILNAN